jgi:hypothetical protein
MLMIRRGESASFCDVKDSDIRQDDSFFLEREFFTSRQLNDKQTLTPLF